MLGCVLLGAAMALAAGQDAGFDLRNYHWYDAWAALHGRLALDVAPAQLQTYFNPALDVVYYAALRGLGSAGGAAAMGALHGLVPGLVGCLALRLLPSESPRVPLAALCAGSAAWAPVFLAEVGTSQGDLIIAALVLAGLLVLLQPSGVRPALGWGVLTGLALGLKPTAAPFVLAGLPVVWLRHGRPGLVASGAGGVAGWSWGGGWWAALLMARYRNPFFPMMNGVFRSDWAAHDHFFDQGYFPAGADWLLLPLRMAQGGEVSWFYAWRDARMAVLLLLAGAWLWARRGGQAGSGGRDRDVRHLLLWAGLAWLAWLRSSSMIRYLAPLEAAAPVLCVAALAGLAPRRVGALALGCLGALALWLQPADYERVPFAAPGLGIGVPPPPRRALPRRRHRGRASELLHRPRLPAGLAPRPRGLLGPVARRRDAAAAEGRRAARDGGPRAAAHRSGWRGHARGAPHVRPGRHPAVPAGRDPARGRGAAVSGRAARRLPVRVAQGSASARSPRRTSASATVNGARS